MSSQHLSMLREALSLLEQGFFYIIRRDDTVVAAEIGGINVVWHKGKDPWCCHHRPNPTDVGFFECEHTLALRALFPYFFG